MIINRVIKNPKLYAIMLLGRVFPDTVKADAIYLRLLYRNRMKKKLNLQKPETYNEKLQWLKLYDRQAKYTDLVDKYVVKSYVENLIGKDYIIPTLGVWDNFEDINFDRLPQQFVLKCTHDSGGLVICTDKANFNEDKAKKRIQHALKRNYYLNTREWPYKNVKPRIIAEEYLVDEHINDLQDYKFFVFDGRVEAMFVATGRNTDAETCFDFFDRNFNYLPMRHGHPNASTKISKPENFDKMIEIAEILGKEIPHVRVDLYNVGGRIYFGEMTFFHWSGFKAFEPEEYDNIFGEWIKLPKS